MEGQMHLSGQISDWSIEDVLQIMKVTNKTGSLEIEGQRQGRVHFREGRVTGAELKGVPSSDGSDSSAVADTIYVLSTLEEGSFSVGAADGPDGKGWTVEEIVREVEILRSLEADTVESGLIDAASIRMVPTLPTEVSVDPDDWGVLAALIRPFNFAHLEARHGRGPAVRILHTLHRLGVAEATDTAITDEDESDWLDRVSDDVAGKTSQPTWIESVSAGGDEKASVEETPDEETDLEVAVGGDSESNQEENELVDATVSAANRRQRGEHEEVRGLSAPASTTLTDGVYDEIRRLRGSSSTK